jgi:putative N6-adenine-specific DNA methylase
MREDPPGPPPSPGGQGPTPAFQKRVRRQVAGREHAFFAVTAPGLEPLCLREITDLGIADARAVPGGVEFRGKLPEAYRANLHLRTASRILMRLFDFRADSFRALESKAGGFPWELYFGPQAAPRVQVATHHCRLHHSGAIAERVAAAVARRAAGRPGAAAPAREQLLYLRGLDDRFLVSIDTSGANLYLRGLKTHGGRAPLRETIAAACLILAGYQGGETLLDPMCGSGTFSLEAALIAKRIPPGWFREFAFMGFPAFRPPAWNHLKSRAGEGIAAFSAPRIFASDIDPEACGRLHACLAQHGLADAVAVACRDFFDVDPGRAPGGAGLAALNPPYGRRLGGRRQGRALAQRVAARLAAAYAGWRFILLAPEEGGFPAPPSRHRVHRFPHGGAMVKALVGTIAPPMGILEASGPPTP